MWGRLDSFYSSKMCTLSHIEENTIKIYQIAQKPMGGNLPILKRSIQLPSFADMKTILMIKIKACFIIYLDSKSTEMHLTSSPFQTIKQSI